MKMISKLNLFIAICMLSSMFAIEDPYAVCATGAEFDDGTGTLAPAVMATWQDDNPFEGCGADEVEDCDGTGECWPALWVGDGYPDCNDQQYGADLTCYDCDGGDCPDSDPGCESCEEQGLIECPWDGSCAEDVAACPESCEDLAGDLITDCADDDCVTIAWIGDGSCDGWAQVFGANLCCYDLDGGDCTEAECEEGADTGGTTGGSSSCEDCEYDYTAYGSECCDTAWVEYGIDCATLESEVYNWDCAGCLCPGDAAGSNGGDGDIFEILPFEDSETAYIVPQSNKYPRDAMNAIYFRDMQDTPPQDRSIQATVTYSCEACLDGGPWEGSWLTSSSTGATGFTVYGFDAGAAVCVTVSLASNLSGENSNTVGPVCAVAGDPDTQECTEGGETCDSGDANGDEAVNVLDIVAVVNVILGGDPSTVTACADVNDDGGLNVLDIVAIVNIILGDGRGVDATSVGLVKTSNSLSMETNGYIGGIQMTLSHGEGFIISLTDDAMVADYSTTGETTTLVIVKPESNDLFTTNNDFVIKDMIIANSQGAMDVVYAPQSISLDRAYPNPFNPSTTINMNLHQDGFASVKVYNLMGQQMAVLAEGNMTANTYSLTWDAKDVPSGVYMIRAESAGHVETEKVMLLK